MPRRRRLAILSSHPIQYYGPLFQQLAKQIDLTVFFAHRATPTDQARAGFETGFEWDIDITSGYDHEFLRNVSSSPGTDRFRGCDTPEIGSRLETGNVGALLVTGWNLKSYIQGIAAAKQLGLPVLIRGDSHLGTARSALKRTVKSVAYPPLLRMFDAALYVGDRSRAYYLHYGYPERRLHHSPHCIDSNRFAAGATLDARTALRAELDLPEQTVALLFGGKLVASKRPGDLIEAAALCRQKHFDVQILIAGDGPLRSNLAETASRLEVPIHFLGFQNQSRMPHVYAASDILILPSEAETWGLVVNEALAAGRPVVVSDTCGCDLAVAKSGAGLIYRVGDIQALAVAIQGVISNPPPRNAIDAFTKQHTIQAAADGIASALGALKVA